MNKKYNTGVKLAFVFAGIFMLTLLAACSHQAVGEEAHEDEDHAGHAHEAHEAEDKHNDAHNENDGHQGEVHDEHENEDAHLEAKDHEEEAHAAHGHEGHNHGEEGEDLEKTVEELFAASCEHEMNTYACDECRYEVGVVKVPKDLIEQELVKVRKVARRNFDSAVVLTGEVQFDERKIVHLSPRVSGVVNSVAVDLGDSVKTGNVLVELESVELAEAQAYYLEALAEKRLAQKSLSRQQSLREKNITSEREFLEAQQVFESAGIRTNSARQKLLRLGLTAAEISTLRGKGQSSATGRLAIRAPFAGDVLELHAVRGERIEPGENMLLVGDTRTLWVWVDLYEAQLAPVNKALTSDGLPVSLSVPAYPDESFEGRMGFVGKVMDEKTRTVKARVTLDNPEGKLKPGMFARVRLELDAAGGKLAVPETAVLADDGQKFVFVHHKDDYFVRRPVKTGRKTGGFVEVLNGLESNQVVAVAGAFLLKSDVLRSKMGAGCAH